MSRFLNSKRIPQVSWGLYDFANTIFSMNIVSLYFALWITQDHGGKDIHYSFVYSGSMLAVILFAPLLGQLADLKAKRHLFLVLSTVVCIIATAFIGVFNQLVLGLLLFFVANIGYQLAQVFYDSLLPSVASKEEYGRVSGLGVALGYVGAIIGILLVAPFIYVEGEVMRHRAFIPTALLFFVFALPCFMGVREKTGTKKARSIFSLENWKAMFRYEGVVPYLITIFFVQNAVNTVILFMSVYSFQVGQFTQDELQAFFIIATTVAFVSAAFIGRLVDRKGPRSIFRAVVWVWLFGLGLGVISFIKPMFWLTGCLIGVGLGGLWTSSRPLLLSLIPEEEAASFFGLNIFTGRFAALIGPLVWGLIVWVLEPMGVFRYRIAVGTLMLFIIVGLIVLKKIPDKCVVRDT